MRPTFDQAKAYYLHRYTMEYMPAWAHHSCNGKFYAPQYANDLEWYEATVFPGEPKHYGPRTHCNSAKQSWPLGHWLEAAFNGGRRVRHD
jgi:hypothetical protein